MLQATTKSANITFDGRVLITEMFEDVAMDVAEVKENYNIVMDVIDHTKFLSLVITGQRNTITKEARESSNNAENYKYCVAQAIVVKSLATRILGNFFVRFAKQHCPHRLFQDRGEALEWLNAQWEEAMGGKAA